MVDHEHLDRTPGRLQLEAELLLYGSEERRTIRIDRWQRRRARWWTSGRALRDLIRRPRQVDVEVLREPRAIHDHPLCKLRQRGRQLGHRHASTGEVARPYSHAAGRALARRRRSGLRRRRGDRNAAASATAPRKNGSAIDCRWTQLRAQFAIAPCERQRVDRQFPGLVVYRELEPLLEQVSHHELHGSWRSTGRRRRRIPLGLGDDVEAIGVDPIRTADDLKVLELVSIPDEEPQRHIRSSKSTAWRSSKLDERPPRIVWLDRRDFKCGIGYGILLRLRSQRRQLE